MDEKETQGAANVENDTQNNGENSPIMENESNAARRLRLLGGDTEDKIHDDSVAIKKGNFFANLWYQHKWAIIIGAVFVVIFVVFFVSIITQPEYDMYIAYAGPLYTDGETKLAIEFAFGKVSKDYNGDGEKLLNYAGITYQNDEQRKQTAEEMQGAYGVILHTNENYKAKTTIQSQMLSGTVAIYLLDEALYREYEANMVDLTSIYKDIDPQIMAGKSGVYFKETDFFYYMYSMEEGRGLNNLPDDTVLCILPKLETMDDQMYESSKELMKAILSFENQ